jgi:hypothetical protein
LCLWLGENIAILSMEKRAHIFVSNRLWAHTILRQSNHWKIDWKLFVKLVVAPITTAARFSNYAAATNPNPCVRALMMKRLT